MTGTAGGGTTALLGDIKKLLAAISPALKPTLIANSVQAASIATLSQAPLPVIVAPTLPADQIVAVDAAAFASALGVPTFRASQNVTLHEDSVPLPLSATGSPNTVAAPIRSAFQTDVTALRSIVPVETRLAAVGHSLPAATTRLDRLRLELERTMTDPYSGSPSDAERAQIEVENAAREERIKLAKKEELLARCYERNAAREAAERAQSQPAPAEKAIAPPRCRSARRRPMRPLPPGRKFILATVRSARNLPAKNMS